MAILRDDELSVAEERITAQWLAGFFDGEGCVTVTMAGVRNPRVMVSLTQQDFNVLNVIWKKFCEPGTGSLFKPVRKKSRGGEMDCWLLHFTGKSCLPILRAIQPFVILKRKLVEWGIEMSLLTAERGKCGRGGSLPVEVVQRRQELMHLVKQENLSGRKRLESQADTQPVN